MLKKIKYSTLGFAFLCLSLSGAQAYTLSTGAEVDTQNLPAPHNKGNGIAAEKWCEEAGKRLPTLEELQEMYEKRDIIGGFTDGFDPGGWPYWAERVTDNPDGENYGNLIIFGNSSEVIAQSNDGNLLKRFGEQGEVQYKPFWSGSGAGAYVRCVSKQTEKESSSEPTKSTQETTLAVTEKEISSDTIKGNHSLTLEELLEMYKNNEISGIVVDCNNVTTAIGEKWCKEKTAESLNESSEDSENTY